MSYYKITSQEMEQTLSKVGFTRVGDDWSDASEDIYEFEHPKYPGFGIRVYSSIEGNSARKKGKDAIRCLFWSYEHDRPFGFTKRIHRITTWEKNLLHRLRMMAGCIGVYAASAVCPTCSAPLIQRKGKNGPFFGCITYPLCRGTRQSWEVTPKLLEREASVEKAIKAKAGK